MPLYKCSVISDSGEKQLMYVEVADVETLRGTLKRDNYYLIDFSVVREKKRNEFFAVRSKARTNEVVGFYRQFSVMLKAGMPINESLKTLHSQKYSTVFKNAIQTVYSDIESGVLLSEAFARHPKIFPEFFINMVAIGEVSGTLDRVLADMADHYEAERKMRERISSSLAYPILLIAMVVAVLVLITVFVFPRFEEILLSLGGDLPPLTRALMSASAFLRRYYFAIIPAIAVVIFAVVCFFKTKTGRYFKDALIMKLPVIGRIQTYIIAARFSRAFVMLLRSGMTIVDCLENLKRMLGNKVLQKKFDFTIAEVKRGKRIAYSLEMTRIFPDMLTEMISVGEKSGSLEEMLASTGDYFDSCVENSLAKAVKMIEPVIIVVIGVIVAVLVFSVILPLMTLMGSI